MKPSSIYREQGDEKPCNAALFSFDGSLEMVPCLREFRIQSLEVGRQVFLREEGRRICFVLAGQPQSMGMVNYECVNAVSTLYPSLPIKVLT